MAVNVEIQAISNQNFQLLVEQDSYDITIRSYNGLSFVSISRQGQVIIRNVKAVMNQPIIPYLYQYREHGNFQFVAESEDVYPSYENYGVTTRFQYITKQEVIDAT